MDAQVQILQVTVRTTRTGKTVYDVACGDGQKRQVWDAALANALNTYTGTGQAVTIRYDIKQNGQYTNQSIQEFAPPGQALPPDQNGQAAPMGNVVQLPVAGQPLGVNTAPIQAAPVSSDGGWTPEKTTRVTKLAAYDYASTLVAGLFAGAGPEAEAEAVAALDRIAKHVYAAARSHEQATGTALPAQGQIIPTATTPAEVAQQVPGVVVGAPVAAAQDAAAEAPDVIDWN